MTLESTITILIGGAGVLWYFICLFVVGLRLADDHARRTLRDFMSLSVTTIGVALATYVGILVGFRVVSDEVKQGVQQAQVVGQENKLVRIASSTEVSYVQWAVAVLYVLSMLLALYFWWRLGDETDPAIIKLGQSLLGLAAGSLSVLLNLPRP